MSLIYQVCKRTILRGDYAENMKIKLEAFVANNVISQEEYQELITMLQ